MSDSFDSSKSRVDIVNAIKTPLGFFTLVVLIVEIILGLLASKATGFDFTLLLVGMIVLLLLLVAIVAYFTHFNPDALTGRKNTSLEVMPVELKEEDKSKSGNINFSDISGGVDVGNIVSGTANDVIGGNKITINSLNVFNVSIDQIQKIIQSTEETSSTETPSASETSEPKPDAPHKLTNIWDFGTIIRKTIEKFDNLSDVPSAQNHFSKILEGFLPNSVIIGSGEIIDGNGQNSGHQDIIIYRADFPVINDPPSRTYLIEGVVAVIEVEADLATGHPKKIHLTFEKVKGALSLSKQAHILKGDPNQISQLVNTTTVKSYIVGYKTWSNKQFLEQYRIAGNNIGWQYIPHIVCHPAACIMRNDGFLSPTEKPEGLLIHQENPFSIFLHHLLKTITLNTNSTIVTAPGIDALMNYDLGRYFNFDPPAKFKRLILS